MESILQKIRQQPKRGPTEHSEKSEAEYLLSNTFNVAKDTVGKYKVIINTHILFTDQFSLDIDIDSMCRNNGRRGNKKSTSVLNQKHRLR